MLNHETVSMRFSIAAEFMLFKFQVSLTEPVPHLTEHLYLKLSILTFSSLLIRILLSLRLYIS